MLVPRSLASLALATTVLQSGPTYSAPIAHGAAPAAFDANAAADTTPLLLTPDLLLRMTAFMLQVQRQAAHLRTLAADSANYAHVPRVVGPFLGTPKRSGTGTVDALLDVGAIAAKDHEVAAAFTRAQLAPAQYLPFATALRSAEITDAMEISMLENGDSLARSADSANVIWRNVAFLRAHRVAIDALGFPLPSSLQLVSEHEIQHFLDTTQHHVRIRYMANPNNGMDPEPWPFGFLDSSDAPASTVARSAAQPLRVLFVGNSLTYYNTMPRLFSRLASRGLNRRVVVGLVSVPGANPLEVWTSTDLRQVIAALPWDVVVVQFKPTGRYTRRTFPYYAQLYTQAIAAHHAQAVLWTQWESPHPKATWQTWQTILAAEAKVAMVTFAPLGQVWETVRQRDDSAWHALYVSGGDVHPSLLGSYLLSLVLYKTITGHSPVGLPRTADSLSLGPLRVTDSLSVNTRIAELLQQAAATARP